MLLEEAKMLFSINNIHDIDEAGLKSRYRKLVKAYHPDVTGISNSDEWVCQINIANKILKDAMEVLNIHKDKIKNIRISLLDLIGIEGDSQTGSQGGRSKVSKVDLAGADKAEIDIPVEFITAGKKEEIVYTVIYNTRNVYNIDYRYTSDNELLQIIIKVAGQEKTLNLKASSIEVPVKFSNGIVIYINIRKLKP